MAQIQLHLQLHQRWRLVSIALLLAFLLYSLSNSPFHRLVPNLLGQQEEVGMSPSNRQVTGHFYFLFFPGSFRSSGQETTHVEPLNAETIPPMENSGIPTSHSIGSGAGQEDASSSRDGLRNVHEPGTNFSGDAGKFVQVNKNESLVSGNDSSKYSSVRDDRNGTNNVVGNSSATLKDLADLDVNQSVTHGRDYMGNATSGPPCNSSLKNDAALSSRSGSSELLFPPTPLSEQPAKPPAEAPARPLLKPHCDISSGKWVADDSYPLYQPGSCPFVDVGFRCQENGRPDSNYTSWRWEPGDCYIPRLNATDMLERLRGKRVVFVGDSLNRNQLESLLCILREALPDKSRVIEIHGEHIMKGHGGYVFNFLDYNCNVEFYFTPYLVQEEFKHPTNTSNSTYALRLDKVDSSSQAWRDANILVFNSGHWWTHDKLNDARNYFQEGDMVYPQLDVELAFEKAINTWARWVDNNVNSTTTRVFFRSYSPTHYSGGQWNSGGQCHLETEPMANGSFDGGHERKEEVVGEAIRRMKRVGVRLLNVTRLSVDRVDGHPSIYGQEKKKEKEGGEREEVVDPNMHQDCSHWCLPGLPDVWNELLYFYLLLSPH